MRKPIELKTSNIPTINLRNEFEDYLKPFRSKDFKIALYDFSNHAVELPSMSWRGLPHDLITLMLQRSILGVEAYILAAVSYELGPAECLPERVKAGLENPFTLNRRVVIALYDKLPELVSEECKLSSYNKALFDSLVKFYETVRNPLFHGNQVDYSTGAYEQVVNCFELLAEVYGWIDTWFRAFPTLYKGKNPLAIRSRKNIAPVHSQFKR